MKKISEQVTRREMLGLMGLARAAAAAAACGKTNAPVPPYVGTSTPATPGVTSSATGTPASSVSCVVSPEMVEGPYFVDELLNRADIRSDPGTGAVSEGVPLRLAITVSQVNDAACTPLEGVVVDVWHCDAQGLYSDVAASNTDGQKFLRGYQLADDNGRVEFTTVYPGWYMGRAVHIHAKVRTDPASEQGYEFTSQLFFDEATTQQVYAQAPYSARGEPDTPNASDGIYQGGGSQMLLALSPEGDGYAGTIHIGVQVA